jgi:hypothetical protein
LALFDLTVAWKLSKLLGLADLPCFAEGTALSHLDPMK